MDFMFSLFRSTWLKILIYIIVGIGVNTVSPHYPQFGQALGPGVLLHSIVQFVISVMLWPLSFWHPTFTVGKWTGL
jgi:hypothetical protein